MGVLLEIAASGKVGHQAFGGCFIEAGTIDDIRQAQLSVLEAEAIDNIQRPLQCLYFVNRFFAVTLFHVMNIYFNI